MSRLPRNGERARILPSETTRRWGVVPHRRSVCVPVRLDDAEGATLPGAGGSEGVVFCTISEAELEEGSKS